MWDPTIGPSEGGLAVAAFVWGVRYVKDRINGGTTRERLIRIETNQKHYAAGLTEVKERLVRVEDRPYA